MPRDLTGRRFGRWTVLCEAGRRKGVRYWECACSCGTRREVAYHSLTDGASKSCGCLNRELVGARFATHGKTGSPEHRAWKAMIQRCLNPNNPRYARYGGRGVSVCQRWRLSFEDFCADVGPRPSPEHSLVRFDRDGPYSPDNCRWAVKEPTRGYGRDRPLTAGGETLPVSEWAERLGTKPATIQARLRRGWPEERAVTAPVR